MRRLIGAGTNRMNKYIVRKLPKVLPIQCQAARQKEKALPSLMTAAGSQGYHGISPGFHRQRHKGLSV